MLTVSLLRHAKSSSDDPAMSDRDRPLSERGRLDAPLMGAYMEAERIVPDLVLCSSAVRTRQTLDLVRRFIGRGAVETEDELYLAEPEVLITRLRRLAPAVRHVLIIGHNPGLELLALGLAKDGDEKSMRAMIAKFPTAALAVIDVDAGDWRGLAPKCGRLRLFMTPKRLPPPPRGDIKSD